MTWCSEDIAKVVAGGATASQVRAILATTRSLDEYSNLTAQERRDEGLVDVTPIEWKASGWWVLSELDEAWPAGLRRLSSPPVILFGRGDQRVLDRCVAVIGTRRMTRIGSATASAAAEACLISGASVVSGLARGCDTAAHEAALSLLVPTVAVIPSGLDCVYPRENVELVERIIKAGGALVTEQPPGVEVSAQRLMARNRIIAALGWVMIVCEADSTSRGTLNAVQCALRDARPLIVPRVHDRWRRHPGAWLLEELASTAPDERVRALTSKASGTAPPRFPIANAVCDDRETMQDAVRVLMHFTPLS